MTEGRRPPHPGNTLNELSGEEFMRRHREGKLEAAPVEGPITVLADLVQPPAYA